MNVKALPSLLVMALLATACQSASSPDTVAPPAGDILIGSDLPLTVPGSDAPSLEGAIRLAISQHPTVAGYKVAYWSLDDTLARAPFPEKAAQNVERLVAEPKVMGVIGPSTSFIAVEVIPVANKAGLVVVSPNNTNACLTLVIASCGSEATTLRPNGQNNFFRIAPLDHLQGRSMARFAARNLSVSSVAVINQLGSTGELYIDGFAQELARQGAGVVVRDNVDEATTDFTAFLAQAKSQGATAIYAVGDANVCFARGQMVGNGMWFLGTDYFTEDPACIKNALINAADMYGTYSAAYPDYTSNPEAKRVLADYRKAYPNIPISEYTFAAYDSARILINAIQRVVTANHGAFPTRAQVLAAVAQTAQFPGLTGTYSFDANGDATSPMMSVYKVENGQWVYKQRIDASA